MFIRIAKSNGRYTFTVGDHPDDAPQACFQSQRDAYLLAGLPQDYRTFVEAHGYAQRLIQTAADHVAVRQALWQKQAQEESISTLDPQSAFVSHYDQYILMLGERLQTILESDESQPERLKAFKEELDGVQQELDAAKDLVDTEDNLATLHQILKDLEALKVKVETKLPPESADADLGAQPAGQDAGGVPGAPSGPAPLPMSAPTSSLNLEASIYEIDEEVNAAEVLRAFAETATLAIQPSHPEAFVKLVTYHPEPQQSLALLADPKGDLLALRFNEHLMLTDIIPGPQLPAYHTLDFFNQYWMPIIDAIGHLKYRDVILVPHHPDNQHQQWQGFTEKGERLVADLLPTKSTWRIKISPAPEKTPALASNQLKLAIVADYQKMLREAVVDPTLPMRTAIRDLVDGAVHEGTPGETHRDIVGRLVVQYGRDEAKRRCVGPDGDPLVSHGYADSAGEFYTLNEISEKYLVNDSEILREHQLVAGTTANRLMVRCVDPKLASLHNRTGVQLEAVPKADFTEVLINFGGKIGNVRLTDRQVKALDSL